MTNPTQPGADELRLRELLRQRGVGPDAELPPMPPGPPPSGFDPGPDPDPAPEPRAWWSHTRSEAPVEKGPEAEEQDRPRAFEPQPGYWPRPHVPDAVHQRLERAEAAISPGTRRLLYNASAAAAGWGLGLYHAFASALADCGTSYSIGGALVLGAGGSLLIAHVWDRRTRHWWPGIAWAARIPLATAILALALWAPASA
jgi:hypothetical protein